MGSGTDYHERARELDAADPLAAYRERFVEPDEPVVAYLDGNSLGRPPKQVSDDLAGFVGHAWGSRLIRGWTEPEQNWMDWPITVGDELAAACLGAAPGQTIIADSTSVLLYKLARAALSDRPDGPDGRVEIVIDADNFPTDRYLLEGIAAELGLTLRWVPTDPDTGLTVDQVAAAVGPRTALLVASHVAYRSGWVAELATITALVHEAGGRVLWDCSHSVGSVPIELDAAGVDLAVGCGYKYLNGGPGAPAFGYVNVGLHDQLRQPLQGWMGHADPFAMGPGYRPAAGIRGFLTGTPPILATVPLRTSLTMISEVGIEAVRRKSLALTDLAIMITDDWLAEHGVLLASPRDHGHRGGHVTLRRDGFRAVNDELWRRGVIGDFRAPDGIRLGLSPLTTSYAELVAGLAELRDVLAG